MPEIPAAPSIAASMRPATSPRSAPPRRTLPFATAARGRRYAIVMTVLVALAVAVAAGILAWENPMPLGSDGFWRIAQLRVTSLIVIVVVAFCQGIATIAFQTVTANRIVTPSLLGFESLYTAISTAAIFFFGVSGALAVQGVGAYLAQVAVMLLFSGILYGWLLSGRRANVQIMLLVGIILGGALAAFSTFLQRLLTPTEFDLLTARLIGSVANADATYLPIAIPLADDLDDDADRPRRVEHVLEDDVGAAEHDESDEPRHREHAPMGVRVGELIGEHRDEEAEERHRADERGRHRHEHRDGEESEDRVAAVR